MNDKLTELRVMREKALAAHSPLAWTPNIPPPIDRRTLVKMAEAAKSLTAEETELRGAILANRISRPQLVAQAERVRRKTQSYEVIDLCDAVFNNYGPSPEASTNNSLPSTSPSTPSTEPSTSEPLSATEKTG